jgi:hypothetical protein
LCSCCCACCCDAAATLLRRCSTVFVFVRAGRIHHLKSRMAQRAGADGQDQGMYARLHCPTLATHERAQTSALAGGCAACRVLVCRVLVAALQQQDGAGPRLKVMRPLPCRTSIPSMPHIDPLHAAHRSTPSPPRYGQVKAEIQALSSFGFQYLTQQYLPQKLREADWI